MFAILNMVILMNIVKIVKQHNNKYKLIFDNKNTLITYDEVILKYNLLQNKVIDDDLFDKITNENNYYDIYNKTVKYIMKKIRSLKEINDYLDKTDLKQNDKNKIIKKLKEIGLINDSSFAKSYINDHINLTNEGPLIIKKNLLKHNIKELEIDGLLNQIDNEKIINKIDKLINKKIKNNNHYSKYYLKQKLVKELNNLGYDKEMILQRIENLLINDDEILIKEFNKAYKKYSLKFQGNELKYKLKQVLYQKGFDVDKINELIEAKN